MSAVAATSEPRSLVAPVAASSKSRPWMLAVAAAHVPLVTAYYRLLWTEPHYQFFPLALGAAYWFYRRDRDAVSSTSAAGRRGAGPLLVLGMTTLAAAVVLDSPWLGVVAALINLAAWSADRGGLAELRRLVPAGLIILITLRPPLGLDDRLIKLLQRITAQAAGAVLDLLDVTHALSGNVIEIPGRRLLVEEACSGVNSFFAATACVLFYVLANRRGWISSLLLFLSIPFWVVFANTLRVVTVTALRSKWGIAADEGLLHDALGLTVFLVAVAMLVSTERLLRFYAVLLERPRPPRPVAPPSPTAARSTARAWQIAGGAAIVLFALQTPDVWARLNRTAAEWRLPPLAEFGEAWLPETYGPWQRAKYEPVERDRNSPFGAYSQMWTLVGPDVRAAASLDYPFLGWHELAECYESQGWRIEERSAVADPADARAAWVEVALRHDQSGRYGRLYFSLATRDGAPFPVRTRGEIDEWLDRSAERLRNLLSFRPATDPAGDERLTYQMQLFLESFTPPDDKLVQSARRAFDDFRRRVQTRLHDDAE